jgi:hypothetical protein
VELIEGLHKRTLAGALSWEKTSEEQVFQVSLSHSVVKVAWNIETNFEAGESYELYWVRVYSEEGSLIDEISHSRVDRTKRGTGTVLRDLYIEARRSALDYEAVVDSILDEIESI